MTHALATDDPEPTRPRRVIVESPFGAPTPDLIARNVRYARLCLLDCLRRGEAPYASHLLYTQVWDDADETEREAGIAAGHAWYDGAEAAVVYDDLGRSRGMNAGIRAAAERNVPVHFRVLPSDLMARLDDEVEMGTEGMR